MIMSPTAHHFAITPDNDNDLEAVTRSIWIGTGGDLVVVDINDHEVTFKNVPSGTEKQGRFKQVRATGTTAGDLVGGY